MAIIPSYQVYDPYGGGRYQAILQGLMAPGRALGEIGDTLLKRRQLDIEEARNQAYIAQIAQSQQAWELKKKLLESALGTETGDQTPGPSPLQEAPLQGPAAPVTGLGAPLPSPAEEEIRKRLSPSIGPRKAPQARDPIDAAYQLAQSLRDQAAEMDKRAAMGGIVPGTEKIFQAKAQGLRAQADILTNKAATQLSGLALGLLKQGNPAQAWSALTSKAAYPALQENPLVKSTRDQIVLKWYANLKSQVGALPDAETKASWVEKQLQSPGLPPAVQDLLAKDLDKYQVEAEKEWAGKIEARVAKFQDPASKLEFLNQVAQQEPAKADLLVPIYDKVAKEVQTKKTTLLTEEGAKEKALSILEPVFQQMKTKNLTELPYETREFFTAPTMQEGLERLAELKWGKIEQAMRQSIQVPQPEEGIGPVPSFMDWITNIPEGKKAFENIWKKMGPSIKGLMEEDVKEGLRTLLGSSRAYQDPLMEKMGLSLVQSGIGSNKDVAMAFDRIASDVVDKYLAKIGVVPMSFEERGTRLNRLEQFKRRLLERAKK